MTKIFLQKQSLKSNTTEMLQNYATNSQKDAHAEVRIQQKPECNCIEITLLHGRSPQNPSQILRTFSHRSISG